jgi:F420-dependent oxidoreductase-like protein
MRLGLQLPSFTFPGGAAAIRPTLQAVGEAAEAAGLDSLWVMDHWFQLPEDTGWGGPEEPMLEAYTALGYLASVTERIALGPLVVGAFYRHPGLLIKTATTLDVLAGGRTYFGIGAGWYEREARGLGVPYPPRRERFERLEETLQIARAAWSGDRSPYEGRHYQLAEPIIQPLPISQPRPRIMVGGNGPRKTMRLVAQYGDASNFGVPDPGESRRLVDAIHGFCDEIGRDPAEVEMTTLAEIDLRPGRMTPEDVVRVVRDLGDEGVDHVIVNMPEVHRLEHIAALGNEVLPEIAQLGAAVH